MIDPIKALREAPDIAMHRPDEFFLLYTAWYEVTRRKALYQGGLCSYFDLAELQGFVVLVAIEEDYAGADFVERRCSRFMEVG